MLRAGAGRDGVLRDLCGLEAGREKSRSRIAVPMAIAQAPGRHRDQCILDPRGDLSFRTNMFKQQERSPRFEDTPELLEAALRVTHGTEDERDHPTAEMRIRERECFDRDTRKPDGYRSGRQCPPSRNQHRLVRLHRFHALHTAGIILLTSVRYSSILLNK